MLTGVERKIICVDMDEVIADALSEHLLRYNRQFKTNITPQDLHGQWIWDYVPHDHQHVLWEYMISEDFFSSLDVLPDAQRVIAKLQKRYSVYIATAAMEVPSSFNAKFKWLAEHFPFVPATHIVFCGDKSILRGDYLIDDNPRQLRLFESAREGEARREGILFSAPANALVEGFRRVNNWLDVEKMFLG